MFSPYITAESFVSSLLEAIAVQSLPPSITVLSVHMPPESVDVQMFPPLTTAASFVPSLLEEIPSQFWPKEPTGLPVHIRPESGDVQMLPPATTAASFAPSALDVTDSHACAPGFTPRGQMGSGWQAVHSGADVGGTSERLAQTPHLPRPFRGFSEHSHRKIDTSPHFFRSSRPCTAAHASGATAHPAPWPPHLQAGDCLHARFSRGAHSPAAARAPPPEASAPPARAAAARDSAASAASE